jgi:hypothetical protein
MVMSTRVDVIAPLCAPTRQAITGAVSRQLSEYLLPAAQRHTL